MPKGYISEFMNGGRIVAHGQITDLTQGFRLAGGALFTVYARPKDDVEGVGERHEAIFRLSPYALIQKRRSRCDAILRGRERTNEPLGT